MTEKRRRITYLGGPTGLRVLVHELERQGVQVRWDAPKARRSEAGAAGEDYVELDTIGTEAALASALSRVRDADAGADVRVEHDDPDVR